MMGCRSANGKPPSRKCGARLPLTACGYPIGQAKSLPDRQGAEQEERGWRQPTEPHGSFERLSRR
ncbi:hypothetical protein BQ8794_40118 [Mesorhizobium prunaredense]|uniref:Uncharacterized protein n=1 Tax=Mesorhizobium prunaredense TaxID=1631249 RepID=A0A1R3VC58_9HYPH|nr:hypothetical protein BQ8794_40118 [Mesorhizobium prunaredense]